MLVVNHGQVSAKSGLGRNKKFSKKKIQGFLDVPEKKASCQPAKHDTSEIASGEQSEQVVN